MMFFSAFHHQKNRGNRQEFGKFIKLPCHGSCHQLDIVLLHIEFSFNNYVDKSTCCIPFKLVYGFRPNTLLNINSLPLPHRPSEAALDFSRYIRDIHEEFKRCPIVKKFLPILYAKIDNLAWVIWFLFV